MGNFSDKQKQEILRMCFANKGRDKLWLKLKNIQMVGIWHAIIL